MKSTLTKSTYKTDETKALYIDHIYGGALLSDPFSHSLNGQLSGGLSWVGWVIMFLSNNHVHSFPSRKAHQYISRLITQRVDFRS